MSRSAYKKLVFGPVPSRRLGRSLGVDLIPFKTCTLDCVYCQIGKTPATTVKRDVYAPAAEVIEQVSRALERGARPDVITISGSGEPTLHLEIGDIIRGIKSLTETPVAVLTNGTLLFLPEVRQALFNADIVAPDLDAGSAAIMNAINRPHPSLDFGRVVEGLEAFAAGFGGRLLLEVFLVEGINDNLEEVKKTAAIAGRIKSAGVQLNTVSRPTAEPSARGVDPHKMSELARLFDPPAEVIADFKSRRDEAAAAGCSLDEVLEMLARRPCTIEDVASGLGISPGLARKLVSDLLAAKKITEQRQGERPYFTILSRAG